MRGCLERRQSYHLRVGVHEIITIITFLIGGAATYALLLVRNEAGLSIPGIFNHFFPWRRLKSRSTFVDVFIYFFSKLTQKFIALSATALTVAGAVLAAHQLAYFVHDGQKIAAGPGALVSIGLAMFICADFGEFLSHYLQHKIPFLWQFHKVHHSALFLTPLTTARFHPVGNILDGILMSLCLAVPTGIASFFFSIGLIKLLALAASVQTVVSICLLSPLQHSHFNISFGKLEWIFISPQMHQVHHSTKREHWDKNMASRLAIWDWLFGTGFRLPRGESLSFGLGTVEDQRGDYKSILWCYGGPIIGCYRLIQGVRQAPNQADPLV
jgi:sterol desaturase/sphingolipid hydroxylase (fatty acid hydroxylase superfamily)